MFYVAFQWGPPYGKEENTMRWIKWELNPKLYEKVGKKEFYQRMTKM
jgi:hypothetical protein